MVRAGPFLLLILAFLFSFFARNSLGDECVKGKEENSKKPAGLCEIKTRSGRFTRGHFYIDYSSASLECGGKTAVDSTEIVKGSLDLCLDFDPSQGVALPYSMTREIVHVSGYKDLVSVETTNGGFTGGAHPYAVVKRATYSVKTGTQVRLDALYGKASAEKILAEAGKSFAKKKMAESYQFEPDSFSIAASGDGRVKITFAAPHSVELYRGTSLEVSVTTDPPKGK